jgi:pSer/pThr/pTyr-binding forkhead associated (FHA) protein
MSPSLLLLFVRIVMGAVLFGFLIYLLVTLRQDLKQQAPRLSTVPSARLVFNNDPLEGVSYSLENVNLIGRAADNTIKLDHDLVSAHHARLSYLSGLQWWLEDLGSRNGTIVNGIKVDQPLAVTDGDEITFGTVGCTLVVGDQKPGG